MLVVRVWEEEKPEDILYSKTIWLLFLALFLFFFSHISLQATMFTALDVGNVNWIFRVKGSWTSLEESPKALKKKVVQVAFEVCGAKVYQPTVPQKKLGCCNCDVMLCVWEVGVSSWAWSGLGAPVGSLQDYGAIGTFRKKASKGMLFGRRT